MSGRSVWLRLWTALVFAYLYIPVLILVVFSFNTQRLNLYWEGFTLDWYVRLAQDTRVILAAQNSFVVALVSTSVSTVLGTGAALALVRSPLLVRLSTQALLLSAIIVPDVVLGIALLVLFSTLGVTLGLDTVIVAHILLGTPFVALTVRTRLAGYDASAEEAAMDLGATELVAFWRVTLPTIWPGVLSGALLAFTLSLDDYVVTLFTAGPGATTLPLRVFSMVRTSITPEINALSTLWILGATMVLLLSQFLGSRAKR